MGSLAQEWSLGEIRSSDYRGPLAAAIASGDAAKAEAMTKAVMGGAIEALTAAERAATRD